MRVGRVREDHMEISGVEIKRLGDSLWEIPRRGGMNVPGRIYSSDALMDILKKDRSPEQVVNVAHLPGIVGYSLAMPDIHWGYGFPIGGVAAMDCDEGVISPGGVGYDINCGCRLISTSLSRGDLPKSRLHDVVQGLFAAVPAGVGSRGGIRTVRAGELKKVMKIGARWAVENGYGLAGDLERTEEGGAMAGADPDIISDRAIQRGLGQIGTLGSGNHFLEIDAVDEIYDPLAADAFGLFKGQIVLLVHSGSRGFGYQVCDDSLKAMMRASSKYGLELPDRQLACAPVQSPEGKTYFSAMACAANYAWANRQCIQSLAVRSMEKTLGIGPRDLGARLVYDVCHNIAKMEEHDFAGQRRRVCVHRKGATRAFAPGSPDLPDEYRSTGQPVLIPGDMGTGSFVCVGTERAMAETFGSTCHGAGRVMSRKQAIRSGRGRAIHKEMKDRGIVVMAKGGKTLAEEMPEAYKDVNEVVETMHRAGISAKVARLRPLGVMKG